MALSIDIFNGAELRNKTVRIGLIADTHIPRDARILPPHVKEAFRGVDFILHAGDIYLPHVLDELEAIAPVLAARGNGDGDFPPDRRLDDNQVLNIAGLSLGLTHAIGYVFDAIDYPFDKMMERKFGKRMDIIVSGDSHAPSIERHNGVLLVNPGSPVLPYQQFELGTVGLLEIKESSAQARIVQLSEFALPFERASVFYLGHGA